MNFLAHALLAEAEPALLVGGIAGDWVKVLLPGNLPPDLARGVALHRAIDSHAETHPAFCASRRRISAERRRYAGVLVDIFYDHCLARTWNVRHPVPLATFAATAYREIAARTADLPEGMGLALEYMVREDWLSSYADIEYVATTLGRMSRRLRRANPLVGAEAEFMRDGEAFAADFEDWLSGAHEFVRHWMSE